MARAGAQRLKTDWRNGEEVPAQVPTRVPASGDPDSLGGTPAVFLAHVTAPGRFGGRGEKKTARDLQQHHLRDLESFSRTLLPTTPARSIGSPIVTAQSSHSRQSVSHFNPPSHDAV
jgi:hypothetical protein